ncbi:34250_t:CDS:2, partial [Gigaspora margarita]
KAYSKSVEYRLRSKANNKNSQSSKVDINEEWDIISSAIVQVATKHIPGSILKRQKHIQRKINQNIPDTDSIVARILEVLAHADNTTWVIDNQKSIQETIDISNKFYKLNNIKINLNKTELVVFTLGRKEILMNSLFEQELQKQKLWLKALKRQHDFW